MNPDSYDATEEDDFFYDDEFSGNLDLWGNYEMPHGWVLVKQIEIVNQQRTMIVALHRAGWSEL